MALQAYTLSPCVLTRQGQGMKGLVLSGGAGTRLRPITYTSAKQLVPVANKPVLFFALEALVAAGITEIGIVVGDTRQEVRTAVGDGSAFGAKVTYIEQEAPLGLAHAVKISRAFLGEDDFVLYLGDNLIRDGITELVERFATAQPDALVLLASVPHPERFGVAELKDGQVVRLVEKPAVPPSNLALVGVYLFSACIFDAIAQIQPSPRGELEITDAIQQLITGGKRVEPHIITGWWKDTGRLEDMLEANRVILERLEGRIEGEIGEDVRLEGAVVVEKGATLRDCTVRGPAIIGSGTLVEHAYIGPFTSVHDRCRIVHCEVENSIVLADSELNSIGARVESSLIGRGCFVGRSTTRPRAHKIMIGDHSRVEVSD